MTDLEWSSPLIVVLELQVVVESLRNTMRLLMTSQRSLETSAIFRFASSLREDGVTALVSRLLLLVVNRRVVLRKLSGGEKWDALKSFRFKKLMKSIKVHFRGL